MNSDDAAIQKRAAFEAMSKRPAAVIVGVGPSRGLGASLARRFAREGLHVFVAGRTERKLVRVAEEIASLGGSATPWVADATRDDQVTKLFERADGDPYELEVVASTVDSNVRGPLLETDAATFESVWRNNCMAGFLVGRAAVRRMIVRQRGTLIFTGASASLRARPPFTAFGCAKAALRALAQGMAREFGPKGIHVAHVVIDGVIDGDRARAQFPDFVENKGAAGLLNLEAIADAYWALHCQPASSWTHELDLRPFNEPF